MKNISKTNERSTIVLHTHTHIYKYISNILNIWLNWILIIASAFSLTQFGVSVGVNEEIKPRTDMQLEKEEM